MEQIPQNNSNPTNTKDSAMNKDIQSLELKKCLYEICEPMCNKVVQSKPKDIANFMLSYLKSTYNYSSSGLRFDEQKELENLRSQVEMFKDMEEHAYYSEQSKQGKKEVKPVEKKGRGQPKPKPRLPYEDNVLSDDEDYKNLDDVDPNLDNLDFIKNFAENNKRISVTENCFIFDKQNLPSIKTHKKNPDLFEFIRINLIKSPVFSELNFDVLKTIIDAMEEKNFSAVTDVVKQGDLEESFYFVAEGELECKMQFTQITQEGNRKKVEKFEPKLVRIYNPGDYFGELSLLYHTPRRGTIRAITDVKLYTLNRSTYKLILRKANEEKTEKIINALRGVKILSMLEDEELEKLESITKETVYSNGEIIIKENEFSNTLMILEKGKCIGTKTEEKGKTPVETSKYKDGDVLFDKAILRPEKSEENILANSDVVKFICVDRNGLKNNLGQYENILMRNMDLYQEIFPPEEEKKDEEEEKRKEEEERKKKEEEEEKKRKEEEERKKKEEEEKNKISPEEEIKIIKEQHEKEIDDYKKQLQEQQEKYQQLLIQMQQQQQNMNNNFSINPSNTNTNIQELPNNINSNINTNNNILDNNNMNQFSNNDLNNNIALQSGANGSDMNQFNNMDNNNNMENSQQLINQFINVDFVMGTNGENGSLTIQCKIDDQIQDLIDKFKMKTQEDASTKKFVFNTSELDPRSTAKESGLFDGAKIFVIDGQQSDNNMMNQDNKIEEDQESNVSNPPLLKEKIIYNENEEINNAQMDEQNERRFNDPFIPNVTNLGYMAEA